MPLQIRKSVGQMVAEATAAIETLSVAEARALHGRPDVTFVDLRDIREIWREGAIPGARQVQRGMLEFWLDPGSPYHFVIVGSLPETKYPTRGRPETKSTPGLWSSCANIPWSQGLFG